MNVCPLCANPIGPEALSPIKPTKCDRCGWEGKYGETIHVEELSSEVRSHQLKLETLYTCLAKEVSPLIGKILIDTGMVAGPDGRDPKIDKDRVQFLAKVLRGSTKGTVSGIAEVIKEAIDNGRH